jgi:hypothetical protein
MIAVTPNSIFKCGIKFLSNNMHLKNIGDILCLMIGMFKKQKCGNVVLPEDSLKVIKKRSRNTKAAQAGVGRL